MKVSLKWLSQYVNIDGLSAEEIAHKLTFAGIEVEEIKHVAYGTNLVVGEIIECQEHPTSNHLHILQVDEGKFGLHQIVCGAPNARVGLKVIVARENAQLPKLTITKSVIRGVESDGMCCSLVELGVDPKYLKEQQINGIEELPQDAPVGREDVLNYLNLDDVVLDLKLLANRSDCLAILNVAREVGALFNRKVKIPQPLDFKTLKSDFIVSSNTSLCPQISVREVHGVKVKESPKWMKDFLLASGVRPINNVVDIANYIMLLTGQPLHMYDEDKLESHQLQVTASYQGDFVALDEKTYSLINNDIVIMNNENVSCLAGIMGSLKCAVTESTQNIVIEAATFDAKSIRHTTTRLNLSSESSQRFIKGINRDQAKYILDLAADLLKNFADAKEIYEIKSDDKLTHTKVEIRCSTSYINNRLGTNFEPELIINTLKRVNLEIKDFDGDNFVAIVPSYRIDISLNADLSEEVIRLLGFEHVKSELPKQQTTVGGLKPLQFHKRNIRDFLVANGFYETLNYTLINENLAKYFSSFNVEEEYVLLNPMTEDHKIVRKVLLPSLLETLKYNISRQARDLKLFEVSEVFTKGKCETHLAVVLFGNDNYRHLLNKIPFGYEHVKGIFESIMNMFGINKSRYQINRISQKYPEFHPGRAAEVSINKKVVAIFGEAHPNFVKEFDLFKGNLVMLEVNLSEILALKTSEIKAIAPSKYQSVERDLALVMSKEITSDELIKVIIKEGHGQVSKVEIFDVYEGEHIQKNMKSVAVKITYEDNSKSFVSEEINALENKIKDALKTKLSAILRS